MHQRNTCDAIVFLPKSRLDIEEVGFVGAWNKSNARLGGDILHAGFYCDSLHII